MSKPSQKATVIFETETESLPHAESQVYVDHTKRREINEFVGELRLDLHKAGITPSKVKRETNGLSTGSGEASIGVGVAVTAPKEALLAFVQDPKMQKKYFDFDLSKEEWEDQLAEWKLLSDEDQKVYDTKKEQKLITTLRTEIKEDFAKIVEKIGGSEKALALFKEVLKELVPPPISLASGRGGAVLPEDQYVYELFIGQDEEDKVFVCSPTELDNAQIMKFFKEECVVDLYCAEEDVEIDLFHAPTSDISI